MTRHIFEIADLRHAETIAAIEAAGEARAAQVAQQPREAIIRLAHDDGRYVRWQIIAGGKDLRDEKPAIVISGLSSRPPLLRRLVWPGVLVCALGLALMGVLE